eukprot:6929220-Pyramimonas_sp.AAC.1
MSQSVCLSACATSSALGAVCEDVSGEALVSALTVIHRKVFRENELHTWGSPGPRARKLLALEAGEEERHGG